MDPVKILKRSWYILWSYRALWVFGLILTLAAGSASGNGSSNSRYEQQYGDNQQLTPHDIQQGWLEFKQEVSRIIDQGIPEEGITGEAVVAFLWVIGAFVLVMFVVGIVMAIARYVSETAVIRMVEGETTYCPDLMKQLSAVQGSIERASRSGSRSVKASSVSPHR